MRGYFGIGIWHPKHQQNQGTLWRSAHAFGAAYCFTIGPRFTRQNADTVSCWTNVPMFQFATIEDLFQHLPYSCPLIGVELTEEALPLDRFSHPARACYILGAEDHGLSPEVLGKCHQVIQIPGLRSCLNVATTGSLVMYDRMIQKTGTRTLPRECTACPR